MFDAFLQGLWYDGRMRWLSIALVPLSWLFGVVAAGRRWAYRAGWFKSHRVGRPVIVVGNITVGGVGKTPLTIWLASHLAARGVRVGVVLRGYGGRSASWPRDVTSESAAAEVGDEAVLLASRTSSIVVAGPDRVADARRAIERGAQIVLCDDGLQHYRLARDCELAVLDAERGLGNGRLLPAGPLREPPARLGSVDLVVRTHREGAAASEVDSLPHSVAAVARLTHAVSLTSGEVRPLAAFKGMRVHAFAAIGHPEAFFRALAAAGLDVDRRAAPDHAALTPADVEFADDAPVLMTEKDAVKCRAFADARLWAVRMEIEMSEADAAALHTLLGNLCTGYATEVS